MADLHSYTYHITRILKVLVHIETNLSEELSLENMAKIACISPFYFHRIFHACMEETLASYVKRLRIVRAREKLQYSETSITEIAFDLGYETPSAFTKVFQQVMGKSPREYRKKMQPLIHAILERTFPTNEQKQMLNPEYIFREEETVLFIRRVGDYNNTPGIAFKALFSFLQKKGISKGGAKAYYSIALDDPNIVERTKCRFDACVSLNKRIPPEGEIGEKIFPKGRYAVFTHIGPHSALEEAFVAIFRFWHPASECLLADAACFCEHIAVSDDSIPESERVTKIYIPLV